MGLPVNAHCMPSLHADCFLSSALLNSLSQEWSNWLEQPEQPYWAARSSSMLCLQHGLLDRAESHPFIHAGIHKMKQLVATQSPAILSYRRGSQCTMVQNSSLAATLEWQILSCPVACWTCPFDHTCLILSIQPMQLMSRHLTCSSVWLLCYNVMEGFFFSLSFLGCTKDLSTVVSGVCPLCVRCLVYTICN